MNIQQLMKQAQQMQDKLQRELAETVVEASVGGGVVAVKDEWTEAALWA